MLMPPTSTVAWLQSLTMATRSVILERRDHRDGAGSVVSIAHFRATTHSG